MSVSFGCVGVYRGFEAWVAFDVRHLGYFRCDEEGEQFKQCRVDYGFGVEIRRLASR